MYLGKIMIRLVYACIYKFLPVVAAGICSPVSQAMLATASISIHAVRQKQNSCCLEKIRAYNITIIAKVLFPCEKRSVESVPAWKSFGPELHS